MGRLAWMKRGLCVALAGVMLFSHEPSTYAAWADPDETSEIDVDIKARIDEITAEEGKILSEAPAGPESPATAQASGVTWQSVTLTWSKVLGADGYAIYRKSAQESEYTLLARLSGAETVSFTDDAGLVMGMGYTYQIYSFIAYTDEGGVTQYADSQGKAVVTATPVLGKANVSADAVDYSRIVLTWSPVDGAEGYVILRAQGSSTVFTELTDVGNALTYTDNSVATGQTYRYKVRAYRMSGAARLYGEESDETSAAPTPAAPHLTAAVESAGAIRLSWDQVPGAAGYTIERRIDGTDGYAALTTVNSGTELSYLDTTVRVGATYLYRILAYCEINGSTSPYSNEVSILATMAAPKLTFEEHSINSITVRWNRVDGAQGYTVYRSLKSNEGFSKIKTIKKPDELTCKDSGLNLGTVYYYKVRAYATIDGKKVYGVYSEAAPQQCVPAAVKLSSEASGTTSVKLTWEKVEMPENSGYYVYQMTDAGEKLIKTCKNTATSCTIKKLAYGEKYTFKVVAYVKTADGSIIMGAPYGQLTVTPKLAAAAIKSVKPSKESGLTITFKYTKGAEEDSVLIYRSAKKKSGFKKIATIKKKSGAKTDSYTDSRISAGKTYYYKLLCKKKMAGGKTIKSGFSEIVSAKAVPAAPKLVLTANGVSSVKISWNKIKGTTSSGYVNGYQVFRSASKKGKFKKVATIGSGTTIFHIDEGLTTGVTYYYKVRAYTKINNKFIYGLYSKIKSIKVVPGQLTAKAEAVDYTTIKVSWGAISGCSGYRIYRSTAADGKFALLAACAGGQTSYDDKKATTGTTYYYKVRAYVTKNGKNIYGKYSNVVSASAVLTMPTGLQAVMVNQTQIKLLWNAVPGAETYTILRGTSPDGKYKIASEICTTNSFLDTDVVAGNIYYYKVYAVRGEYKSETTAYVTAVSASLEVSTEKVVVKVGGSAKVTATAKPAASIIWTSSDPSIAFVSTEGVIYGVKLGTTTVKAAANGITKTINVTVTDKVSTKGVEISKDSGNVDFAAVKAAGYEYVMIRISSGQFGDSTFETNYTKARTAGLKVGVYCHGQARTKQDAAKEAALVLSMLNGRTLDFPVVYEMHDQFFGVTVNNKVVNMTNAERNDVIDAFKNAIAASGKSYKFALYAPLDNMSKLLDNTRLSGIDVWVLNYRAETAGHGYTGAAKVVMWCYTEQKVNGIPGTNENTKTKISISYY